MAQSGGLRVPRVQLIRGLARTKKTANLSADSQQSLPQVSSTAGRHPGGELSTTAGVDEFWFCGSSVIVWRAAGGVVASPTKRGCDRGRAALPRRDARGAGVPREP